MTNIVVFVTGYGCLILGLWLYSPSLALIIGGLTAMAASVVNAWLVSLRSKESKKNESAH